MSAKFLLGKSLCSAADCGNSVEYPQSGLCQKHYRRVHLYGSLELPKRPSVNDRFWSKVNKEGPWCDWLKSYCWQWTASCQKKGYGQFRYQGRMVLAHRFSFWIARSILMTEDLLDHICRNPGCVNPKHLRLATNKQNSENRSYASDTKSGVRGVTWNSKPGKWQARVGHNGRVINCGFYDNVEEAADAVVAKRNELYTFNIEDGAEVIV